MPLGQLLLHHVILYLEEKKLLYIKMLMLLPASLYKYTIRQYLSWIDTFSARLTCKIYNAKFYLGREQEKKFIKDLFISSLAPYIDNPDEFLTNMKKYNHVMSGGWILQVLMGVRWENSTDIDVYSSANENERYLAGWKNEENNNNVPSTNFTYLIWFNHGSAHTDPYPGMPIRTRYFNLQGKKLLNHIGILHDKWKTAKEYIQKTSDFEFLKNIFNGEELYITNVNGLIEKRGKICYNEELYTRYAGFCYECTSPHLHQMARRIKKYKSRGFLLEEDVKSEAHKTLTFNIEQHSADGTCDRYFDLDLDLNGEDDIFHNKPNGGRVRFEEEAKRSLTFEEVVKLDREKWLLSLYIKWAKFSKGEDGFELIMKEYEISMEELLRVRNVHIDNGTMDEEYINLEEVAAEAAREFCTYIKW
jgi:hypothetical protein